MTLYGVPLYGVPTLYGVPRQLRARGLVAVASVVTLAIANAGPLPTWAILLPSSCFFVFASGRFVPEQAIMTLAVPPVGRGAFMSLSGCARDIASGLASSASGWIVTADASGRLQGYHWLGWLGVGVSLLALALARTVRESDQTMRASDAPVAGESVPASR